LTSTHILNNSLIKYYIRINSKDYEFDIIENYKDKDITIWKVKNYSNINFIRLKSSKKINLLPRDKVFTIKNNKKIYWKILAINEKISELKLNNLIKTNIKLEPWDSWSPLFNIIWEIIGINSAIDKVEDTSFAQTIN
jgi:S1-C subfamily serine protease